MREFKVGHESFRFGLIGIYNTWRENAFYKVEASIPGIDQKWTFDEPDLRATTTTIYRFIELEDFVISTEGLNIPMNSCIIFKIFRWTVESETLENYGFAIQPLISRMSDGKDYIACG